MKYVVIDIGCIECGEVSSVLGIFDNKEKAEDISKKYEDIQEIHWTGQHDIQVFEVKEENTELFNEFSYIKHLEEKRYF